MNELDRLMALDPLDLSEQDLSAIIAYHRQRRADYEAGIKPKKETGPKADMAGILDAIIPKGPMITRRVESEQIVDLPKVAEPEPMIRRRL